MTVSHIVRKRNIYLFSGRLCNQKTEFKKIKHTREIANLSLLLVFPNLGATFFGFLWKFPMDLEHSDGNFDSSQAHGKTVEKITIFKTDFLPITKIEISYCHKSRMGRARRHVRYGNLKLTGNEHMNSQIHRKFSKESEKNGLEPRKRWDSL